MSSLTEAGTDRQSLDMCIDRWVSHCLVHHGRLTTRLARLLNLFPGPHGCLFGLVVIMSALQVLEHLSDPHSLEVLSDLALQAACEVPK